MHCRERLLEKNLCGLLKVTQAAMRGATDLLLVCMGFFCVVFFFNSLQLALFLIHHGDSEIVQ